MQDRPDLALADRFYRAWLMGDCDALSELLAEDAEWIMTGRSRFAGTTEGREAIIEMRRQMSQLTGGSWRSLREDSYDIVSSECHNLVFDRYLAQRDGKSLDSHEGLLVLPEGGKVRTVLHYFFDQYAFDES